MLVHSNRPNTAKLGLLDASPMCAFEEQLRKKKKKSSSVSFPTRVCWRVFAITKAAILVNSIKILHNRKYCGLILWGYPAHSCIPRCILFNSTGFCSCSLFLLLCLSAMQKRNYFNCHQVGASKTLQTLGQKPRSKTRCAKLRLLLISVSSRSAPHCKHFFQRWIPLGSKVNRAARFPHPQKRWDFQSCNLHVEKVQEDSFRSLTNPKIRMVLNTEEPSCCFPLSVFEQHVKINILCLWAARSLRTFASENIQGKGPPQTYSLRPWSGKKKNLNKCTNLTMVIG